MSVNVEECADKLLQKYVNCNNTDIDISLPQYTAMAVYQACKKLNITIKPKKFIDCSDLTTKKWADFEQQWNKLGSTVTNNNQQNNSEKRIPSIHDRK